MQWRRWSPVWDINPTSWSGTGRALALLATGEATDLLFVDLVLRGGLRGEEQAVMTQGVRSVSRSFIGGYAEIAPSEAAFIA